MSPPETDPAVKSPWQRRAEFRDPGFADRFAQACLDMPGCPDHGQGRGRWFTEQFRIHFGTAVSPKAVRLWGQGHRPVSAARLRQIATILRVDAAWLYLGVEHPLDQKLNGILRIIAGLIQLDGGTVTEPDHAEHVGANLLAVIRGTTQAFHVTMGQRVKPGVFRFAVPGKLDQVVVLGVLRDGLTFRLVNIPADRMSEGLRGEGASIFVDLSAGDVVAFKIEDFSKPL